MSTSVATPPLLPVAPVHSATAPPCEREDPLAALLAGRRLPALDGLRALAVLVVIGYHFGFAVPAGLGVTGFFVLSGFLITWLLRKEWEADGAVSLRGFYARRTLRIFPAYFAYLAFVAVVSALRGTPSDPALPWALTYTVNYYNAWTGHPDGPYSHLWSLAVEEQFYLLWPLLFLLCARRGRRALAVFLGGAIVVVLGWRVALFHGVGIGESYVYNAFDTRFDSLAVGCLLAIALEWRAARRAGEAVASRSWMPLVTLAALFVSSRAEAAYAKGVGLTIDSVLLAVLIVQLLLLHRARSWRWIDARALRSIGIVSYPMYLYHPWGLAVGYKVPLPPAGQFLVGVAATLVAAAASYRLVERPFLALRGRFGSGAVAGRGADAPSAAAARS